jgi:hypothetical protein
MMLHKYFAGKYGLILLTALCIFHIKFGVIAGWNKIVSDFPNYYVSSEIISENKDAFILYNDSLFNREIKNHGIDVQGQFSLYPPPTAFIMLPLTSFDPLTAKRIWMIFNIFLIPVCILLIRKIINSDFIFAANILLISGFCLTNDLMLGQVYLLMLTVTLGGYLLIDKNKIIAGSILWGIVMALKYFTVVMIPVYLLRKKWKPVIYILTSFILIHTICLFFTGWNVYEFFFKSIFLSHLEGKIIGQNAFAIQFQSFESLFNNLFTMDPVWNPLPFYESGKLFLFFKLVTFVTFTSISLFILFRSRHSKYFVEISSASLITLLLLLEPGSATYHLLLLIIPLVLIIKALKENEMHLQISWLLIVMGAIGFLSVLINKISAFYYWPLLLQYNRLWLLVIFYALQHYYSFLIAKQKN